MDDVEQSDESVVVGRIRAWIKWEGDADRYNTLPLPVRPMTDPEASATGSPVVPPWYATQTLGPPPC